MPEHSYPGVYVVEVESTLKPVEGVSTATADVIGRDCIDRLRRLAAGASSPDWTAHNGRDPGVAVLEVLAYVADILATRADPVADEAMLHSSRLVAASLALAKATKFPPASAVKAVTLYEGRLLRAEDLTREQDASHCLHIGKGERMK